MNKGTLLPHIQLNVHQDPQVLPCKAAELISPCYPLVHEIIPPQVQHLALPPAKLHEAHVSPFLKPVLDPLSGSTILWCISHSSHLYVFCKLYEGTLCPISQITKEQVIKRTGSSTDSWSTSLVTPVKVDSMTNIFIWACPLIQFSVHLTVYSFSLYSITFFMRILWKSTQKALLMSR